jgi:hypothetical protein
MGETHYDLEKAKHLVCEGKYSTTRKGRSWLINHGYDVSRTIQEIFFALDKHEFLKSYPPKQAGGNWADAYHFCGRTFGFRDELYLKFTVEEESETLVVILSCKEWGYGW